MTVSATECAASESMALEPLMIPAIAFATAMPRLATAATMTVKVLSVGTAAPLSGSLISVTVCSASSPVRDPRSAAHLIHRKRLVDLGGAF